MGIGFSYTFKLEKTTLYKALDSMYRIPGISESDLAHEIGVGYKKAIAYSAWLLYLGLRKENCREISPLGELLHVKDPYLEDDISLQLLHYKLCSNRNAAVWWTLSNQLRPLHRNISINQAIESLQSKLIEARDDKNLRTDVRNFFSAYEVNQMFGNLHFLNKIDKENYVINPIDIHTIVLAYILYDRLDRNQRTSTIPIDTILTSDDNVGKIFFMNELNLREKLHELEFRGILKVSCIADLDNIAYTYDGTAIDILKRYYRERI